MSREDKCHFLGLESTHYHCYKVNCYFTKFVSLLRLYFFYITTSFLHLCRLYWTHVSLLSNPLWPHVRDRFGETWTGTKFHSSLRRVQKSVYWTGEICGSRLMCGGGSVSRVGCGTLKLEVRKRVRKGRPSVRGGMVRRPAWADRTDGT